MSFLCVSVFLALFLSFLPVILARAFPASTVTQNKTTRTITEKHTLLSLLELLLIVVFVVVVFVVAVVVAAVVVAIAVVVVIVVVGLRTHLVFRSSDRKG